MVGADCAAKTGRNSAMPEKKIQRRFTMTSQNEQWILLWPGENCQERIALAKGGY
jgi:hypothetical protein